MDTHELLSFSVQCRNPRTRARATVGICCASAVIGSVTYIGGFGFGALIASVIWLSCFLDAKPNAGIDLRIIKSFVAHLLCIALYWTARYFLERPTTEVWKLYRYDNQRSPIGAVEALFVLSAPTFIALFRLMFVRAKRLHVSVRERSVEQAGPSVPQLIGFLSVILPWVWVKIQSPANFLAAFMSGDSRNHFITTSNIRMSGFASNFLGLASLESPLFSNAVAALLSAGSGSTTWPSTQDQFAIAGTWLTFAGIIGVGVVAGIQQRCREVGDRGAALLFGSLPFVGVLVFVPYAMFPMLLDGFFSLFLGSSILFCGLVVCGEYGQQGSESIANLLWLLVICFLLTLVYPILGPLLMVAVTSLRLPKIARLLKVRILAFSISASVVGFAYWALEGSRLTSRMWDQFQASAAMPGSVLPRNTALMVVLLVGIVGIALTGRTGLGHSIATVAVCLSGLGLIRLIESLDGNNAAGLSYYSTKVVLSVSICMLLMFPTQILAISIKQIGGQSLTKTLRLTAIGSLAMVAPLAMAAASAPEPTVLSSVQDGWARPRAGDALAPARFWGRDDVVFFRYVRTTDGFDISEDRILNFWSPAFWAKYDPLYARLWTWSYVELASSDASLLCVPLEVGVRTVVTRDRSLRKEIEEACKRKDFTTIVAAGSGLRNVGR